MSFLLFSIWDLSSFNGWMRISSIRAMNSGLTNFGIGMCVIESLIYTINAGVMGYNVYSVHTEEYEETYE